MATACEIGGPVEPPGGGQELARAFMRRLTPEGRGAIAVVRVWGPAAVEVASTVFRPHGRGSLAETTPGRLRVGRIGDGAGDEVVAVVLDQVPAVVEVQCHGGTAAVELVMTALEHAGAARRDEGPMVGSGTAGPLEALALELLAHATTVRTAEILLDQANGALTAELDRLADAVKNRPGEALAATNTLIARAEVGLRLVSGWRVVIAGRPNVGKSRLLNALAGYQRAIVDPTPGTTRDLVTIRAALGGWPVEIVDTAGIRAEVDAVEGQGIARAHRERERADLVLLVLDRSLPLERGDFDLIDATKSPLIVANKCDLDPAWAPSALGTNHDESALAVISAERGDGLEALAAAVARHLAPEPPPPAAGVPFHPTHLHALEEARRFLLAGDAAGAHQAIQSLTG